MKFIALVLTLFSFHGAVAAELVGLPSTCEILIRERSAWIMSLNDNRTTEPYEVQLLNVKIKAGSRHGDLGAIYTVGLSAPGYTGKTEVMYYGSPLSSRVGECEILSSTISKTKF